MTQTITALFDNRADATAAATELKSAGVPADRIRITPERAEARTTKDSAAYDTERDEGGFWASMKELFLPNDDRHVYAEAMHRGSIMVAATVDDAQAARVEEILELRGTVNIEQREAAWRNEGWTGASTGRLTTGTPVAAGGIGNEKLQIVEERLQVGKRQVNSGRVKIRSYVVETPVSEKVTLREENVRVDQVVVNRALRPGEDPFKERTIEATAMSEEAVVAKQARVTGEVRVVKSADDRIETIEDTVRSTKVDVDNGNKPPVGKR